MITGWLSPDDCPDCGGPLLDTSTSPGVLTLQCPGCGHGASWFITDPNHLTNSDDVTGPDGLEAE